MTRSAKKKLGVFALAMMNVAAVMSLRGLPMMAKEGMEMVFYILFASLLFLVPVSLVSAELATGWPQHGGVYRWVKEAFGPEWGFVAIWLQWIQNTIWYPTVLAYAAGCLSYVFLDPALAGDKFFNLAVILAVYWGATMVNFRGAATVGWLTTAGVLGGTILPAALIIGLGLYWDASGHTLEILKGAQGMIPDLGDFNQLAFLGGIVLLFAGMEVGAVHVTELENPKAGYPQAVFLAMFIIIVVFTAGSFAIASVLPAGQISLNAGIMQAFDDLLRLFDAHWLLPVLGFLGAFGAVGGVVAWVAGPSKGLLATARDGELPPLLQKTNKNGVQTHILYLQGGIVTVISLVYVIMPNVSSAFFLLSALTASLYLVMYMLLYAAAIRLRYNQPQVERTYRVPGGNPGMWLTAGLGFLAVAFAFVVSFFPPTQLSVGSPAFYVGFMIVGVAVFVAAPLCIHKLRKPQWQNTDQAEND